MRKIRNTLYFAFISFLLCSCDNKESTSAIQIKKLDYPSASTVEYASGKLYVMGDDATNLLVLDTNLNIIDSIPIISFPGRRIPKDIKPDIESSALYTDKTGVIIYLFGSGSLQPRNSAWLYNLNTKSKDSLSLKRLYLQMQESKIEMLGIKQINVEGACFVNEFLVLANRGNKSYTHNDLIITSDEFVNQDSVFSSYRLPIEIKTDSSLFVGISGLYYAKDSDQLIMTTSTEDTKNNYEDGAIGKSYLWIINDAVNKLNYATKNFTSINPDKIIDLETIDTRFKGQKIESVTMISETKESYRLVLVADNDDGSSTIFKITINNK